MPQPYVATDANGLATTSITANTTSGVYAVTASVAGVPVALFSLTNLPGASDTLSVLSSHNQNAVVASSFFSPLVFRVVDAFGNLTPGAIVDVVAPSSGASATVGQASYVADANGSITAGAQANTVAGPYVVQAVVEGTSVTTTVALTNLAGPLAHQTATSGTPQSAAVNGSFALPITAAATDAYYNPLRTSGPKGPGFLA